MKLAEQEAEGQIRRATNGICSAMRLTPTLVLTADHCLAANKEGELAFRNGDKIAAIPTLQADGRWRLDISNDQPTNAEVIFYRPGYLSDGTSASHAFDFALIKLDDRLSRDSTILSKNVYKQFLGVTLEKFALLEMTPDVVAQEMKGRTVYAYFFNITGTPENPSEVRDQVKIFSGSILGTQEHKKNNSHTLVWDLLTEPGTSGSPVLDLERHLIVSVCSGPLSKKTHGGGLISAEICQWVKSHDASMKCLRVEGGKDRQEKPGTAKWGK